MIASEDLIKLFVAYGILMTIGVLYDKYKRKEEVTERLSDFDMIQKYLLNDASLATSKKPILWVHVEFEKNARNWSSFGSRTSMELNQPYLFLTIRSIIQKCGNSFNVCLIDDSSFHKIIPGWATKINNLPSPLNTHLRELALANLLELYGGMVIPASFICFNDLYPTYKDQTDRNDAFVGEMPARTSVTSQVRFFPSTKVMGCKRDSAVMRAYITHLERAVSRDYTNEIDFMGETGRWFFAQMQPQQSGSGGGDDGVGGGGGGTMRIGQISAADLGCKNMRNMKPVLIEHLLGEEDFVLSPDALGIYIPADELLKRTAYQWFAALYPREVLESNTMIAKYLLATEVN